MTPGRRKRCGWWLVAAAFAATPLCKACPADGCAGDGEGRSLSRGEGGGVEVRVFLDEQRLTLFLDQKAVFCTPVSTGKRPGWTPLGDFPIISKHARHRSSTYGKLVSKTGKTLRRDVDSRKATAPKGARFSGAPMPNFLRMTANGIGIHAGALPGYPASKGCIRVSREASEILFRICAVGDIVSVRKSITGDLEHRGDGME
jgi:lipoprotein-anchoring transpeptidase ErfK/SrfK